MSNISNKQTEGTMLLITQELEERKKSESLCLAPAAMETTSVCSAAAAVTCRRHHFLQKTDGQRQKDTDGGKDSWSGENNKKWKHWFF